MRITKILAEKIAYTLTAKDRENIKNADASFSLEVSRFYMARVPMEVSVFAVKHPEYFRKEWDIRLYGGGYTGKRVIVKDYVLSNQPGAYEAKLELTAEESKTLQLIEQKEAELREIEQTNRRDIKAALLSLKTFKAVRENFPEAAQYLPADDNITTALIPDLTKLRNRLNS